MLDQVKGGSAGGGDQYQVIQVVLYVSVVDPYASPAVHVCHRVKVLMTTNKTTIITIIITKHYIKFLSSQMINYSEIITYHHATKNIYK